eukprot:Phypoly_transcript_25648.p2 GENE.Phypoly_transcript_25648~~Phypoly_transcript_25648.p2  ORF type:complete len:106 (+),score=8.35 Phypoly_transcript_25648:116-433(+)
MCMRCLGAQFNQVIVWFPITVAEMMALWDVQTPLGLQYFCNVAPIFLSINGFIVLAGNKPLKTWLYGIFKMEAENSLKFVQMSTTMSQSKTSSDPAHTTIEIDSA